VKRRGGETERGRNGNTGKITDSPIHRFPDSKKAGLPRTIFRKNGAGFSLLEVMVAVVIIGFGLLAIMHLFPIGLRASKISQDTTVATFLAQQKMEELRNTKYADIDDPPLSETFASPFSNFTWTKYVSESESEEIDDGKLSKVVIEVSYTPYGQGRRVKLVTFIADYRK